MDPQPWQRVSPSINVDILLSFSGTAFAFVNWATEEEEGSGSQTRTTVGVHFPDLLSGGTKLVSGKAAGLRGETMNDVVGFVVPMLRGSGSSRVLYHDRWGTRTSLCRDGAVRALQSKRRRTLPVVAMFDFMKGKQQKKDEKVKEEGERGVGGAIFDYVKRRAQEDIAKVNAFNTGLEKSREKLSRDLSAVIQNVATAPDTEETLEGLEEVLITSDLGMDTVDEVMQDLRRAALMQRLKEETDIRACLKNSLVRILEEKGGETGLAVSAEAPTVIVFVGANGMGKTTTIGKLATRYRQEGKRVLLAACDTFRAAAVEQLEEWAERADVDIVKPKPGQKNPSGVVYEAMSKAQEQDYDVVIVDTSGRLHTNYNLMAELKKLVNVVKKFKEDGADEVLLVVDASIGRNAVSQASSFRDEVGVSGLAVTKLDGTARAGFVVSVVNDLGIPIKLVGVGEKIADLRDFEPDFFVEGLVG